MIWLFDVMLIDVAMLYAFSLVLGFRLVERNFTRSRRYLEGLLREMLKPKGVSVPSLIIQKSSLISSVLVISSFDIFVFSSFSIMVTLACLVRRVLLI